MIDRQGQILNQLDGEKKAVCIRWMAENQADYKALMRAAHRLKDKGEIRLFRIWTEGVDGRSLPMVWAFRPDITPQDLDGYHRAKTWYESRAGVEGSEIQKVQQEKEKDNGDPGGGVERGEITQLQHFKGCQGCSERKALFSPGGGVALCNDCWIKAGKDYLTKKER